MSNFGMSAYEAEQQTTKKTSSYEYIPEDASTLREDDYIQEIEIDKDKTITVDLRWLIHLKGGVTNEKSDTELEYSLEQTDGYLYMFLRAYEHISRRYYEVSDEMEHQKQIHYATVRNNLIEENKRKSLSKSNWEPAKATIEAEIVTNYPDWDIESKVVLRDLDRKKQFLYHMIDLIKNRASHLQTIINKRRNQIG